MNQILESFRNAQQQGTQPALAVILLALGVSLVTSLAAAALYSFCYQNRGTGSQVHRSFPLLGISITALFLCVQTSLPLSLGLLGALSIIRFRTPIREPEEVGFIMLVIASSIACATFNFVLLFVLFGIAMVTLLLVQRVGLGTLMGRDGLIVLTLSDEQARQNLAAVLDLLGKHVRSGKLESASSTAALTSVQYAFAGLKEEFGTLQEKLRQAAQLESVNVFFSRQGGMR